MKKFVLAIAFSLLVMMADAATYYGFKIGGVAVNSDNYTNVTGSNLASMGSGTYKVVYNPTTNTVTLKNLRIIRTGNDNRCIFNESCVGLTVVFESECYFSSTTCAPFRINADTKFKSTTTSRIMVVGADGDANGMYIADGADVSFDHVKISFYLSGNSNAAIDSEDANSDVKLHHSVMSCTSEGGSAIGNINKLTCEYSQLHLSATKSGKKIVNNLHSFSAEQNKGVVGYTGDLGNGKDSSISGTATFNSSQCTFCAPGTTPLTGQHIIITDRVPITSANFPDAKLRSYMQDKYGSYLESAENLSIKSINSTSGSTDANQLKQVTDFTGIEYLNCLRFIKVNGASVTKLAVRSDAEELTSIDAYENNITGDNLQTLFNSLPTVGGDITIFNAVKGEKNDLPDYIMVNRALQKGWKTKFLYNSGNYLTTLPAGQGSYLQVDASHFPDANLRGKLYALYTYPYLLPSKIATITEMSIANAYITNLSGIENFTALKKLHAGKNNLTSVNFTQFNQLEYLDLSENLLTSVSLGTQSSLETLYLYKNSLSTLNLSGCSRLKQLYCQYNKLSGTKMNSFLSSINAGIPDGGFRLCCPHFLGESNEVTKEQVRYCIRTKGITPYYYNDTYEWVPYLPYILGDMDDNGLLEVNDVVILAEYAMSGGADAEAIAIGYMDGSGGIDVNDVVILAGMVMGS